jgi:hypothetical protein
MSFSARAIKAAVAIVGLASIGSAFAPGVAQASGSAQPVPAAGHHSNPHSDDSDQRGYGLGQPFGSYRGPRDDGFKDTAKPSDYDHFRSSHGRGRCQDSDDPDDYTACHAKDFKRGGPVGGDGYNNRNRRAEDDNVPAQLPPGALFTNKKTDHGRQLSPPGSFTH